jgi:signal transduction histidine kinase
MPDGQQLELDWEQHLAYFSARMRKIHFGSHQTGDGVLYLLHDITEKKQREKFRSEFIDLLSHELKTPLQSLGTATELLIAQKPQMPEDARLLIDTVSEDVERIRAVAQEFVQITQSQARIMKLKMERVAVNEVLPEWIKPFSVVAKDRKVKIEFQKEGSEVIWANLDLVKFPWVISNILSNAVRFSPESGVINILLTDRTGGVEIQIRDQGPGIPEAEQNRIFEPFYQSAMTTPSGSRGLFGIGLTIAKEVVEAHDGRIEYYRVQPHGSEFRIVLPFPPLHHGQTISQTSGKTKSWTH